ncbi:MAG: DUF3108 domain-containing protein [candidate division WOR-3 bacterium]
MKFKISLTKNLITLSLTIMLISKTHNLPFCQSLEPFSLPEKLEYEAKYGFLRLGRMILEISDTTTMDNKKCYAIVSYLNSSSDLNFIFSLNDTIRVFTTVEGLLPVQHEKRVHEGKYQNYQKLTFNQDSLFVTVNDSLKVEVREPSRDLLSFWYYLRRIPLIENDTINLIIFESKQPYNIEGIIGKTETVKTSLGQFSAIRVILKTAGKGVFGSSGSMDIWYSNDKNRLPVQIKTRMKFGTVVFKLQGVSY